jgi:hypothetical protein
LTAQILEALQLGTIALLVLVIVLVLSRFAMQIVLLLLPFRVLLTHVVGSCGEICHRLQRLYRPRHSGAPT